MFMENPTQPNTTGHPLVHHGLLAAQQGRPLVDDLEGGVLVHPPLQDEVLLQHLRLWLVCPRVEDLTHTQLI